MKYFGPVAGINETDSLVTTPVGAICDFCEEAIVEGDRGVYLNHTSTPFVAGYAEQPTHQECLLRTVVGSVGHILGICHCHGGTYEDPPGFTRRESAESAFNLYAGTMFGRKEFPKDQLNVRFGIQIRS